MHTPEPGEIAVPEFEIEVKHEAGLHLRPAALFVQTAARFKSDIQVRNITRNSPLRNAKSALEVMMLGVSQGCRIAVHAEGPDAEEALAVLRRLVESNFSDAVSGVSEEA